jgi:type IV pilus assembly protein PilQ
MQKRKLLKTIKFGFLLVAVLLIYLSCSCVTGLKTEDSPDMAEKAIPRIESIHIVPGLSDNDMGIEIVSSEPVTYTSFKLSQPLRLIMDIDAAIHEEFVTPSDLGDRILESLEIENIKEKPLSTRVIAFLSQDFEHAITKENRIIKIYLSPKEMSEESSAKISLNAKPAEKIRATEPRLFFSPGKGDANRILGVDFFMLSQGRSRIVVTASKKTEYKLKRRDASTLILEIKDATIPEELTRYLDSSKFTGVVDRIVPLVREAEKKVDLIIKIREMVPFYLMQAHNEIRIDFNETSVKPPPKKIAAAELKEKAPSFPASPTEAESTKTPPPVEPPNSEKQAPQTEIPKMYPPEKKYTGEKMTLDFSDADIRNILKLIGEISTLNIVWGPEVKGTVSMRLKNVPWDQALDLVLETNDLGMRREGNIIWVTTKDRILNLKKEEEEKIKAEQERIKALKEAQKEAKLEEPLVSEYIPVNFAEAKELVKRIDLTKRGKKSVDERTNTIYIKDTESSIEEAKRVVKKFDTAVKQIMIEARIVDASTNFSRDLGVRWNSIDRKWQRRTSMAWEQEPTNFATSDDTFFGGGFSSNAPVDWSTNLGLRFARLTNKGLGTITLDASLALGESEGVAKIISAPKVIASNGEEAKISRGDTVYKEIIGADTADVKELTASLSLTVTPTVSSNNYVTMEIEVTDDKVYSDLSGKTAKEIETKLMVKSGDTLVVGGIYRENENESESGIPWLRDMPFFGWLFKAKKTATEKSELLIFITPTVLTEG